MGAIRLSDGNLLVLVGLNDREDGFGLAETDPGGPRPGAGTRPEAS